MKRLLKWVLGLLLLAVALTVVFFLSLDPLFRVIIERNIQAQSGLRAEIGKFHFGLTEPVVDIKDLRLYNSKEFGGAPFLSIPEIHVEYDRGALKRNQIHITLLRFNLGELDVVRNQAGQTNIFALGVQAPGPGSAADGMKQIEEIKKQTGMGFQAIDCLNVSVGELKYLDLQNQSNDLEQKIGIDNFVVTNVTSAADLVGLGVLVTLRSGDFFKPLVSPDQAGSPGSAPDLLKMLGR